MAKLLVIGCASFDLLSLEQDGKKTQHSTVGGAGLYTALAARCAGADVTLFAPKPEKLEGDLQRVDAIIEWLGPTVPAEKMPRLEIVHHGSGRATLKYADWAAEQFLLETNLPHPLESYNAIHIAALSCAERQLQFLEYCRGQNHGKISVGTYAKLLVAEPETVKKLFDASDMFFMNENEAKLLFGPGKEPATAANKLLFVTRGERGVSVHAANWMKLVFGCSANEVDPTGAGDTFCGTVLGRMLEGESAIEAATKGVERAARCIESVGPAALLAPDEQL
jgi:sugar/nucleoside kinase (ribokinase family)